MLTGDQIRSRNLIEEAIDLDTQIQACGVDLSIRSIEYFTEYGIIDFDNSKRENAHVAPVHIRGNGEFCGLDQGAFLITFNEIINVPKDCAGIARPRSTMLRNGATMETALFDPGYRGRPQCLLVNHNKCGIILYKNARVMQLVFIPLSHAVDAGYNGIYQNENLK